MTKTECSIPNCGKAHLARGWCSNHYKRWRKHGDPLGGGTSRGEPMRFYREVVLAYDGDDCLTWPYAKISIDTGYGYLDHGPGTKLVHRLVCEEIHGPPPTPEHEAAHLCGNGHLGCCTPRHLAWKTRAENEADKVAHGTRIRGDRHRSTKLSESAVLEIRALRGVETNRSLADRFGVSCGSIGAIHSGRSWSWL